MVRFSKFNLVLKLERKSYKFLRAINVCEFVKIAKFANINRARTFVDLQYLTVHYTKTLSLSKFFGPECFLLNWVVLVFFSSYKAAIAMLASGNVDAKPMISHRFKLSELEKAFELARKQPEGVMKVMIDCSQD